MPRSVRSVAHGINYYEVLEVSPAASLDEIRASFKRLILKAHPDKNPSRSNWSEKRVRELIRAFEVVGNAERRAEFDLRFRHWFVKKDRQDQPFFYRKSDPESRALLILHHLLNGRPETADELLCSMEAQLGDSFLREYLDRADYLDSLFLLSEYYTARRQYLLASRRLQVFYRHEQKARFPRHYMDEVVRRLKDLYLKKLPRFEDPKEAMRGLKEVKGLGLSKAEELLRLQKLGELQLDCGHEEEAQRCVSRGLKLEPDFEGLLKLQATLKKRAGRKKKEKGPVLPI